jgi:hypothetical protein
MNLQHQRIVHLCEQLRFVSLADQYSALAQTASSQGSDLPRFPRTRAEHRSRRPPGA